MDRTFDVFLSCDPADRDDARQLYEAMTGRGERVLWDLDLKGDQQWLESLRVLIGRCDVLAVLMTQRSLDSDWVKIECAMAIALQKRIRPILLGCPPDKLPEFLKSWQAERFDEAKKRTRDERA